ncbi:Gp49 family protein [Variovorax sp. V15]|uniref:Gp49 family protein n=1 Tax=Variovorax sp. V15 TaxID=3065952 RepID=UPI0034E8CBD3
MSQVLIPPTVGRVVWFYPSLLTGEAGFASPKGDTPLAAIIAHVWSDTLLNLAVFDANGASHSRTSVRLIHEDLTADRPSEAFCMWMPFQKGQAKAQTAAAAPPGDAVTEQLIVAKSKTAPRVTPADLADNIVDTEIIKHVGPSGQILRWAVLTTRSGFAVTGRPSAAVSAENDDPEIGVATAIENARNELWPLMGYALKQRLHEEATGQV